VNAHGANIRMQGCIPGGFNTLRRQNKPPVLC